MKSRIYEIYWEKNYQSWFFKNIKNIFAEEKVSHHQDWFLDISKFKEHDLYIKNMNYVLEFLYTIINHDSNINHSFYITNILIQSISYNHDLDPKISIKSHARMTTIQDFTHEFNQIISKR